MKEEALAIAKELGTHPYFSLKAVEDARKASDIIFRLVEELDKKQQGLVEASGMLFNYKYELDLERAMSAQLKEELNKQNPSVFTILTCGCKSEFMGFPSEWDGETRECEPCVNYGSLCEKHFMEYEARPAQYTPQTKPLSDEEIKEVERRVDKQYAEDLIYRQDEWVYLFARAIEERHGINEKS